MLTLNKVATAAALVALSGAANAAIVQYTITGGNWDSTTTWNNNADGTVGTFVYDNGETPALQGVAALTGWSGSAPGPQNGTYSGTIDVDDSTNEIVGGSLVITGGSIGDMVVVGGNTWWYRELVGLTVDFNASDSSASAVNCYGTALAPVGCGPSVTGALPDGTFAPLGGIAAQDPAGAGGTTYLGATFDGSTLLIFHDGRTASNAGGTDSLAQFTLQTSVVPVPAAVWLFGSALGLMGVARRRLAA